MGNGKRATVKDAVSANTHAAKYTTGNGKGTEKRELALIRTYPEVDTLGAGRTEKGKDAASTHTGMETYTTGNGKRTNVKDAVSYA
ncbi:hypothetical protein AGMMS50296_9030 [Alphaproteobacteria bacterium]|nr:hypothetical protein AGMMS50296_9030 [Alphaproteobacteria bacterium]